MIENVILPVDKLGSVLHNSPWNKKPMKALIAIHIATPRVAQLGMRHGICAYRVASSPKPFGVNLSALEGYDWRPPGG